MTQKIQHPGKNHQTMLGSVYQRMLPLEACHIPAHKVSNSSKDLFRPMFFSYKVKSVHCEDIDVVAYCIYILRSFFLLFLVTFSGMSEIYIFGYRLNCLQLKVKIFFFFSMSFKFFGGGACS